MGWFFVLNCVYGFWHVNPNEGTTSGDWHGVFCARKSHWNHKALTTGQNPARVARTSGVYLDRQGRGPSEPSETRLNVAFGRVAAFFER